MASGNPIVTILVATTILFQIAGPAIGQVDTPAPTVQASSAPDDYGPGSRQDEGEYDVPGNPAFEAQLHDLNRRILTQEIEFAKFNIRFKQQGNVQGRWKGLRYFASQEVNSVMTVAGLTGQVVARERSLENTTRTRNARTGQITARPRGLNKMALERAGACQMIGQQVASVGSALELCINAYHAREAKRKGFDDKTALKKASEMRSKLKALLAERDQLVASVVMQPSQREIVELEGKILKEVCNLTFDEYRRFHISNASYRAFQNSLFFGDFAKSSVGWVGNLLGILSQSRANPRLGGPNGVCTTISGFLIAGNPITSRMIGKIVEIQMRRKLNKQFGVSEQQALDSYEHDKENLRLALLKHRQLGNSPVLACEDRLAFYEVENSSRERQVELAQQEIRAGQRTATQTMFSAQVVGGTKMVNGITQAVAGYKYPRNQRASFPLVVDGQIVYLAGSSFSTIDNIRIQVQAEMRRRKLANKHLLPKQVYQERLKTLETFEKSYCGN